MRERSLSGATGGAAAEDTADDTIEVAGDGSIVAGAAARQQLAAQFGTWRPIPHGGDLLVLTRARPHAKASRGIRFLGSIESSDSLLSALHFLAMGQESGALHIESDGAARVLYLHRGKLLSARSSRVQDRLGEVLLAERLVTREQIDACFRDGSDSDLLGRALLRRGLLTNHQIYEALRRQTQEIFTGAMMVESGVYYLVKPLDMSDVPAMLHLDVQELLFEGLRRSDELKHLRSVVPSDDVALEPTGAPAPDELSEDAARLLLHLDGRATLAELFESLHLDGLSGVKAAAELIEGGLAAEVRAPVAGAADDPAAQLARSITATYERAMQVVLAAAAPDSGPARRELVAIFLNSTESFADLLRDVAVADDGSLDDDELVSRAAARGGEGVELLRRALHELLFFLLFEVGQRGDHDLLTRLHREIADILAGAA